jgi:pyruvate/2-oxoglutarate dehydrogenase complex dihydrolipoamide acyltransferase (E2) component
VSATIKLPKFGVTMEQATVVTWEVVIGQRVAEGDVLAIIESEKAEMELPSPVAGLVASFLVEPDVEVPVGEPILVLARDEDELATIKPQ